MKTRTTPFLILLLIFITACGGGHKGGHEGHSHENGKEGEKASHDKKEHKGGDQEHESHGQAKGLKRVHMSPKKIEDLGIMTDTLQKLALEGKVEANGRIGLTPSDRADMSALIGGRVRSVSVIEGDRVQKGEVLCELENPEYTKIQKEYLKNKKRLPYLKKEFERQKRLLNEEVGSEREFQKAQAEYQSTKAEQQALKADLKMLDILGRVRNGKVSGSVPVRAPFDGTIGKVSVSKGQFVSAEEPIVEVLNLDRVHLDLKVFEKDLARIEKGQKVFFRYANKKGSELMKGNVFKVGRKYHTEDQGLRFHVSIPEEHKSKLVPGGYVNARVKVGEKSVPALPEGALIRSGEKVFVFAHPYSAFAEGKAKQEQKEKAHKVFARVPVREGVTDAGYTEVHPTVEVPKGVEFVTQGAYYLQAEMKKSVGGHHH